MDAGKLDRRITLQRASVVDDGFSSSDGSWSPIATVWAQYLPQTATERAQAAETTGSSRVRFRIRKAPAWSDLNAKDRLTFGGGTYNIVNVAEPDRGWLVIDAVGRSDG